MYNNTNVCVANLTAREGDQRYKHNANIGDPSLNNDTQHELLPDLVSYDNGVFNLSGNNSFSSQIIEFSSDILKCWYSFDYSENIIKTYVVIPITKLIHFNCSIYKHIRLTLLRYHPKDVSILLIYYWNVSHQSVRDLCKKIRVLMCRQSMSRHNYCITLYITLQLLSLLELLPP
jgi:hypothetical protein